MLQVDVNVSELREFTKRLPELKEGIFPVMNLDLKVNATQFLIDLLAAEFSFFIGCEKYERDYTKMTQRYVHLSPGHLSMTTQSLKFGSESELSNDFNPILTPTDFEFGQKAFNDGELRLVGSI